MNGDGHGPRAHGVPPARVMLEIKLEPRLRAYLTDLVATGLYGDSIEEAAERIICEQIRALLPRLERRR